MNCKKVLEILILSISVTIFGSTNASADSKKLEIEARGAIKRCNENLKSSTLICNAGCGLAYKACLDEGGLLVSKEVERIYRNLIIKPDCEVFAGKMKGRVDDFIIDAESDWNDWGYLSEFSLISYLYLYDSLLLIQKKCEHG